MEKRSWPIFPHRVSRTKKDQGRKFSSFRILRALIHDKGGNSYFVRTRPENLYAKKIRINADVYGAPK